MAPKPVVRTLRWIAFADQLRPSATVDVDGKRSEIESTAFELADPSPTQRQAHGRTKLAEARVQLADMVKDRETVREVLWPPDEPEDVTDG